MDRRVFTDRIFMRECSRCDAPPPPDSGAVSWRVLPGTSPWPGASPMAAADHHLLVGLLALQYGIIERGELVAAFQAWTLDKSRSLADYLQARGVLSAAKRALLEALAAVHLEDHGGDVNESLAALSTDNSTRRSLARIGDPEIG